MKYLFKNLIIILTVYLVLNFTLFLLDKGHTVKYSIGNYNVEEFLKTEKNNEYFFNIKGEKTNFSFQINYDYKKNEKILKKLYSKKIDGYDCYLPIFKNNKILTDVMCIKESIIYNANYLNNDEINNAFKKYGYNISKYKNDEEKITVSPTITLYKNNLPQNNYLAIESYKGLTMFGSKELSVNLFENDIYKKPISVFNGKYYLVADYSSEYTFKKFHIVNLINGNKKDIRSYDEISFDSYIMGVVENEIYLFDKENQKQYKINIENEMVEQISGKDNIKYYNGKWINISLNEALNEKKFQYKSDIEGYEKVDLIDDIYYLYKKENDDYLVYKMDKRNKKIKMFLFKTNTLDDITYLKDKIYFRDKNNFNYFKENQIKRVITDTELEFNDDISLGVYEK